VTNLEKIIVSARIRPTIAFNSTSCRFISRAAYLDRIDRLVNNRKIADERRLTKIV
jgi:hypothetical protein